MVRFFDPIFAVCMGFSAAAIRVKRETKERFPTEDNSYGALWKKGTVMSRNYFRYDGAKRWKLCQSAMKTLPQLLLDQLKRVDFHQRLPQECVESLGPQTMAGSSLDTASTSPYHGWAYNTLTIIMIEKLCHVLQGFDSSEPSLRRFLDERLPSFYRVTKADIEFSAQHLTIRENTSLTFQVR